MIAYPRLFSLVTLKDENLVFDFKDCSFLSTMEIVELFLYASLLGPYRDWQIQTPGSVVSYLERVNFFYQLEVIAGLSKTPKLHHTEQQERLIELQTYHYKPDFYGEIDRLLTTFNKVGLSSETGHNLGASISELIDNSFSHNLGQWQTRYGPLATILIQQFPNNKELHISVADLGIGFLKSLRHNYPQLKSEQEAIGLAIQENVTGRPGQVGGNGLSFLQKNVFNGFKGSLTIRSNDTYMQVTTLGKTQLIQNGILIPTGVHVCFSLQY